MLTKIITRFILHSMRVAYVIAGLLRCWCVGSNVDPRHTSASSAIRQDSRALALLTCKCLAALQMR